jgi:hypothetical protein
MRLATLLFAALAVGCGNTAPPDDPGPSGGNPSGPGSLPTGGQTGTGQAAIHVELLGADSLTYADGSRISLERFVVNLGRVSLLRDLSDPGASPVELSGRQLPIIGPPGEPVSDRYIIGRESLLSGGFHGVRLNFSPPDPGTPAPDDDTGGGASLFVRGTYFFPTFLDPKGDGAKISPNPAPIEPVGTSTQSLGSEYGMKFTFASRRVEDVLVGVGDGLAPGDTLTVVFRANEWFTNDVRAYLAAEASARHGLGPAPNGGVNLPGEGFSADDPMLVAVGRAMETAIVDSIGIELN